MHARSMIRVSVSFTAEKGLANSDISELNTNCHFHVSLDGEMPLSACWLRSQNERLTLKIGTGEKKSCVSLPLSI